MLLIKHGITMSSTAVVRSGIDGNALSGISSFLTSRVMRVRVRGCFSRPYESVSGIVQSSVMGHILYKILIDSQERSLKHPRVAFADDITFAVDIDIRGLKACKV